MCRARTGGLQRVVGAARGIHPQLPHARGRALHLHSHIESPRDLRIGAAAHGAQVGARLFEQLDRIGATRLTELQEVAVQRTVQVGLVAHQIHPCEIAAAGREAELHAHPPLHVVEAGHGIGAAQLAGAGHAVVQLQLTVAVHDEHARITLPRRVVREVAIAEVVGELGVQREGADQGGSEQERPVQEHAVEQLGVWSKVVFSGAP